MGSHAHNDPSDLRDLVILAEEQTQKLEMM
jgi:hypothetical protein